MLYQAMQEQYGLLFGMNELFPILSESHLSWDADLVAVEVVGLLVDFDNQSVEDVVSKAVARPVFITDG